MPAPLIKPRRQRQRQLLALGEGGPHGQAIGPPAVPALQYQGPPPPLPANVADWSARAMSGIHSLSGRMREIEDFSQENRKKQMARLGEYSLAMTEWSKGASSVGRQGFAAHLQKTGAEWFGKNVAAQYGTPELRLDRQPTQAQWQGMMDRVAPATYGVVGNTGGQGAHDIWGWQRNEADVNRFFDLQRQYGVYSGIYRDVGANAQAFSRGYDPRGAWTKLAGLRQSGDISVGDAIGHEDIYPWLFGEETPGGSREGTGERRVRIQGV